jgi:two-component system, LytTR family, response regulator
MKLRVVIADDEALGRQRLRHLLRNEPKIEVVAECENGAEALTAIREKSPDLVFLDIKMPELDGFGVLEALNGTRLPAVIFVTAYDEFAAKAFEMHAVDYLVKPFDRKRFQTALSRARHRLRADAVAQGASSLSDLLGSLGSRPAPLEHLTVKSGDRIKLLKVGEIDWICSADNYAELHTGHATHLVRITISALAEQLPRNRFARISRSHIVNVDHIKEILPKSHGDYLVLLRSGARLHGTRNYRRNLAGLLGKSR